MEHLSGPERKGADHSASHGKTGTTVPAKEHTRPEPSSVAMPAVPATHRQATTNPAEAALISSSELSSRLWQSLSLERGMDEILVAAIKLMKADKGNVQLLDNGKLMIVAHCGFSKEFLEAFRTVGADDNSACGRALRLRQPVIIEDVETDELYEPWRTIAREAGYRSVISTPVLNWQGKPLAMISVHFAQPHQPDPQQLERLDQYLRQAGEFLQRFHTEQELRRSEEQLRAILDATADALVCIDGRGDIITFNRSAERIFGYTANEICGQHFSILVPEAERELYSRFFRLNIKKLLSSITGIPRDLFGRRKNGDLFPVQLIVCEVDHDNLFVGSVRDMSEHRALQAEILRIASLEQQHIGQELHDGIQQELSGVGLLAQALVEELNTSADQHVINRASRVANGVLQANSRVQALARGLVPTQIEGDDLTAALSALVTKAESDSDIACSFESSRMIHVGSNEVSTHLYKIAQEAIGNAIKHSGATAIVVRLRREMSHIVVEVVDNGKGIHLHGKTHNGVGLRLMAYRASLVGGNLIIKAAETGGTLVRCSVAVTR